jgi:hypothetical protein
MDQAYWLGRERDAIANARAATLVDVQLIHYGLAHRYSNRGGKGRRGAAQAQERPGRAANYCLPAVADTPAVQRTSVSPVEDLGAPVTLAVHGARHMHLHPRRTQVAPRLRKPVSVHRAIAEMIEASAAERPRAPAHS